MSRPAVERHADPDRVAAIGNVAAGVTTGVTGQRWRATVTPWGDVHPWAGAVDATPVRWFIAADDRWHVPADETAVRQRRLEGTPVVETRVRVPDGDAVQRVWSVADGGGLTLIEIENESSRPFAIAFSGGGLVTERPTADVPVQGIDLPADTIVLPVGHRSSVRVAIPHAAAGPERLARAAPSSAVVSGWLTVCEAPSRFVLPDSALVEAIVSARSDLLLEGPAEPGSDPLGFLFDVAQLTRLGDGADAWLPEIVEPVALIARRRDRRVDDALVALERLALAAGDQRAAKDLAGLAERRRADGLGDISPGTPGSPTASSSPPSRAAPTSIASSAPWSPVVTSCRVASPRPGWEPTSTCTGSPPLLDRRSRTPSAGTATGRPCCGSSRAHRSR